jgi:hypothetical protein
MAKSFGLIIGNQIRKLELRNKSTAFNALGITVWIDDNLIGTITDDNFFSVYAEFHLDDGSLLKIERGYMTEWRITLNGQAAIGSWDDLHARIKYISNGLTITAGTEFSIGIIDMILHPDLLSGSYIINDSVIRGAINALFGILIGKESLTAVIFAIIFNISFLIIRSLVFPHYYYTNNLGTILVIAYFLHLMLGLITIIKLKKAK